MNSKELTTFCESLCGNYWISLDARPDLIDTVINHPDFSHVTQRYPHSLSLYFYCEGSPTGVSLVASIDVSQKENLLKRIDPITAALHC